MIVVRGLVEFLEYGGKNFVDLDLWFFVEVLNAIDEQFAAYVACVFQVLVLFGCGFAD